jgi:hypothetical protein
MKTKNDAHQFEKISTISAIWLKAKCPAYHLQYIENTLEGCEFLV